VRSTAPWGRIGVAAVGGNVEGMKNVIGKHLALRHAARARGLHQIVDRARRDTLDVGLLDRGD
jgi:hypothetical protein